MTDITRPVKAVDRFQQRHRSTAFLYAVIKKYGDDQGGYQSALLTYYGFLSLFPLLLVFTTLVQLVLSNESHLKQRLINGATTYFPIVGKQLQESVHGTGRSGIALIVALLFTFYGARGVADALRNTTNNLWRIPLHKRSGFFPALLKNLSIIVIGGIGFIGAAVVASYATGASHEPILRALLILTNLALIFLAFLLIMRFSLAHTIAFNQIRTGAAIATIGLFLLQNIGGYVVTHQLKNLDNLYGTFAVVLGLLFWIYLQAQLFVYAMEVDTVRAMKLWPRSIISDDEPKQDRDES